MWLPDGACHNPCALDIHSAVDSGKAVSKFSHHTFRSGMSSSIGALAKSLGLMAISTVLTRARYGCISAMLGEAKLCRDRPTSAEGVRWLCMGRLN